MSSMTAALLALAIASLSSASPIPGSSKSFSIQQSVPKPFKAGPVALANVYLKFKADCPSDVLIAANQLSDGSVTNTPDPSEYDQEYLCPVSIGGETLNLDFDTGSADLWVFSSELSASERSGHSYYDPSKSSTSAKKSGYTWSISYGDGSSASGDVYTDDVNVGGTIVTGQAVELASTISTEFQEDTDNDGLLGLAFSSINTVSPTAQTTFFQTAIDEGALDSNLFTADLKKGAPGTYDFGYIDDSKYNGDITYTDVDSSQGFWEFTANGYAVGGASFTSSSIDAIADTGTTLLLMDDSIVTAYYAKVSGAKYDSTQGGYTFSCSATLPDFTVGIEEYKAVVPGTYMNYAPLETGSTTCFGGLQSNSGIGLTIFGDIFLKSQFVVFDSDGPQLGFAAKDT